MSSAESITIIGFSIIFFYAIIQICKFYNIETNVYSPYLFFYVSIVLTMLVIPSSVPST